MFDDYRFELEFSNRGQEILDGRLLRVVGDIEAVVFEVDLDILNALKPIQGFLDLVRSSHSGDAGGFDEARDSNRDESREVGRGPRRGGIHRVSRTRSETEQKHHSSGDARGTHALKATT